MPNRAKEISHLKGEEVVDSESEEVEEVAKPTETKKEKKEAASEKQQKVKGDADSSSEEEDSEDDVAAPSKAQRRVANAKLKKDLEKEQKELAKVLMTNRQRKLYNKAEDEQKSKKE